MSAEDRKRAARPDADLPIIDVARAPLGPLSGREPKRVLWMFAWLKVVRPLVTGLFWLVALRYVWMRLFSAPGQLSMWEEGTLYAAALGSIFVGMLVLVRVRHRQSRREASSGFAESSVDELAAASNLPAEEIEHWQQAQRLVVHHDEDGNMQARERPLPPDTSSSR